MEKSSKENIIFLHLPKNGGTTINGILDRFYESSKVFTVKWVGEEGNLNDFIQKEPHEREKIKLLRGHFDFGMHKYFDSKAYYFAFLRKPEERIASFYYYVKRTKNNRLYNLVTENKMTFREFIEYNDKDANNGQIRKLSGLNSEEEVMLALAKKNINEYFPVVGIQEMFDESIIVLAHYFSWPLPYYRKENVTRNKNELLEDDLDLLMQKNRGDTLLYNEMKLKLKEQIKTIKFFKLKLFWLRTVNFLINLFKL